MYPNISRIFSGNKEKALPRLFDLTHNTHTHSSWGEKEYLPTRVWHMPKCSKKWEQSSKIGVRSASSLDKEKIWETIKLYNPIVKKVVWSINVKFDEKWLWKWIDEKRKQVVVEEEDDESPPQTEDHLKVHPEIGESSS